VKDQGVEAKKTKKKRSFTQKKGGGPVFTNLTNLRATKGGPERAGKKASTQQYCILSKRRARRRYKWSRFLRPRVRKGFLGRVTQHDRPENLTPASKEYYQGSQERNRKFGRGAHVNKRNSGGEQLLSAGKSKVNGGMRKRWGTKRDLKKDSIMWKIEAANNPGQVKKYMKLELQKRSIHNKTS